MTARRAEHLGLRLIETEPDAATTRLHLMVGQRETLRASFQDSWRRIEAFGSTAEVERWSAAAVALLNVHAGPGALLAYLRVTLRSASLGLAAMAEIGTDAAAICRQAGRRAAETFIDAVPTLTAAHPGRAPVRAWCAALVELAHTRPDCLPPLLRVLPALVAATDAAGLADWIAAGLRAAGTRRTEIAAYFGLETALSRRVLSETAGGAGFVASQRALSATFRALWGIRPVIRARAEDAQTGQTPTRVTVAGGGIVLVPARPPVLPDKLAALYYEAALAHVGAHATFSTRRLEPRALRPVQIAVVSAIEDARVEALAVAAMPGLRRLWAPFHRASPRDIRSAEGLIARLARALLDPAYVDPDEWVAKGTALFAAQRDRLADLTMSREIGNLLGNDLGQMRLPFNAKTYVVEPAYRDDNFSLWDVESPPDTPVEAHELMLDSMRLTEREDDSDPDARQDSDGTTDDGAARAAAGVIEGGVAVARYPEWDYGAAALRPDWATVREHPPTPAAVGSLEDRIAAEGSLAQRIQRVVKAARIGRSVRLRRQLDGEQIDLDAAIDAAADRRLGRTPDSRLFQLRVRRSRDLAALILLDTSESTRARLPAPARSVLESEVIGAAVLSEAMSALGDAHAIWGFCSDGRDKVQITEVKGFDGARARSNLAGLAPGLSTRLGPAVRHATTALAGRRALRKLLLVITDGQPSDVDVDDPAYLVEDARHAVAAARRQGIDTFGILLDLRAGHAGRRIFGSGNTLAIARLADLPSRLAMLYFRLALR